MIICQQDTVAHKGHAANKKETLQTKKKRRKQKRNAANKKETLQTKKKRCKQKRNPWPVHRLFYPQSHARRATMYIIMQINGENEEG